jgi:3-carboxy-cis,cis-muconate cycloisomerase
MFGSLLSDPEIAILFGDKAAVRSMLDFEIALAASEEELGVIPAGSAKEIESAASQLALGEEDLRAATLRDGHPVGLLVNRLRRAAGEAGGFVHWGTTAQDAIDTALVLRLKTAIELLDIRLVELIDRLSKLADKYRRTTMVARTRSQQAVPMTFGLKVAGWLAPLIQHRTRLAELRPRLLVLQFGGAGGTLGAIGNQAFNVSAALAARLDLGLPLIPWHAQRDTFIELAGWLSLVTVSLGKIGQDVVLMAQSEVGELTDQSGGASTAMPQKSNPVLAETVVALARANASLLGGMQDAGIAGHERDGAAWTLEWLILPQMVVATGTALLHAQSVSNSLVVNPTAMRSNLERSKGLVLAEAATYALSQHMQREAAIALVSKCCSEAASSGEQLLDLLKRKTDAEVDWVSLSDYGNYLGAAEQYVDAVLRAANNPVSRRR